MSLPEARFTRRQAVCSAAAGATLAATGRSAAATARPPRVRVIPLQTGTISIHPSHRRLRGPAAGRFARILADPRWTAYLPIHAWLVEHPEGLFLVDTGETPRVAEANYFPNPVFRRLLRYHVGPQDGLTQALGRAGHAPAGLGRVVLTHLHTDHTGGLGDVAGVPALVAATELARPPVGAVPERWPAGWQPTPVAFEDGPFGPFDASHTLTRAGDVRLLPTPGHTAGHLSVAVDTGRELIVLAGDASFTEGQVARGEVAGIVADVAGARDTLRRLRELARTRRVVYLPTHDAGSRERLAASAAMVA